MGQADKQLAEVEPDREQRAEAPVNNRDRAGLVLGEQQVLRARVADGVSARYGRGRG
jgi:hypothetical protein